MATRSARPAVIDRDSGDPTELFDRIARFAEMLDELKRFYKIEAETPELAGTPEERKEARDILENSVRTAGREITPIEMARGLSRLDPEAAKEVAAAWQSAQPEPEPEQDREADRANERG